MSGCGRFGSAAVAAAFIMNEKGPPLNNIFFLKSTTKAEKDRSKKMEETDA